MKNTAVRTILTISLIIAAFLIPGQNGKVPERLSVSETGGAAFIESAFGAAAPDKTGEAPVPSPAERASDEEAQNLPAAWETEERTPAENKTEIFPEAKRETEASSKTENETNTELFVPSPENTGVADAMSTRESTLVPRVEYHDSLGSATQALEYNFTLTQRGVVKYTFKIAPNDFVLGDWKISLCQKYFVNGDGGETAVRLLNVLTADTDSGDVSSPNIGVGAGDYVLKIEAGEHYSALGFDFILNFSKSTGYEIECNDTVSRYTDIYPDFALKGSASFIPGASDTDWYMLRTYSPSALTLRFSHETRDLTTVPFVVTLFDENMKELYRGNSAFTTATLTSGTLGLPAGVYYIRVQSRVYSDMDYMLLAKRTLSGSYEQEPNDSTDSATLLPAGTELTGAVAAKTGVDRDYYKIELSNAGYVKLSLKNAVPDESSTKDSRRITLMDEAGNRIYAALLSDDAEGIDSPEIGLYAGTYFLRVDSDNLYENPSDYTVSYVHTPAKNWESEYNGIFDYANELDHGITLYGTLSDVETEFDTDWYRFTVTEASRVSLTLRHKAGDRAGTLFKMELQDSKRNVIDTVLCAEQADECNLTLSLTPGVYFIKLTAGDLNTDERYSLRFETVE